MCGRVDYKIKEVNFFWKCFRRFAFAACLPKSSKTAAIAVNNCGFLDVRTNSSCYFLCLRIGLSSCAERASDVMEPVKAVSGTSMIDSIRSPTLVVSPACDYCGLVGWTVAPLGSSPYRAKNPTEIKPTTAINRLQQVV